MKKVVKTKRAGPKAEHLLVSIWRILGSIGRVWLFQPDIRINRILYGEVYRCDSFSFFSRHRLFGELGQDFHMLKSVRI